MLTFRQFLECNDIDTKELNGKSLIEDFDYLRFRADYIMYCNAVAMESNHNSNHKAYVVATPKPIDPEHDYLNTPINFDELMPSNVSPILDDEYIPF